MKIGMNIKKYRGLKSLTQGQVSQLINKSLRMIQKYESGEVIPSLEVLGDIASALQVDIDDLLGTNIRDPRDDYYFDTNLISELTYDLYEEVYNHSRVRDEINLTAKEFLEKDKYFIENLANIFIKSTLTNIETQKNRILNSDNTPVDKPIEITYKYKIKDKYDAEFDELLNFVLGDKLNNKKYLEFMKKRYDAYLKNLEEGFNNYELIELGLKEAKEAAEEFKEPLDLREEIDLEIEKLKNPRIATQKDIDNFYK